MVRIRHSGTDGEGLHLIGFAGGQELTEVEDIIQAIIIQLA
jgi:hypothetical protein